MPKLNNLKRLFKPTRSYSVYERILITWIVLASLLFTLLVPPLQKPDEYIHFRRAVALSNGLVACSGSQPVLQMQNKYQNVYSLVDKYSLTQNYKGKFYYKEYFQPFFTDHNGSLSFSLPASSVCGLPFISYIPQSSALLISNIINLSGIYGFYLGRLVALVFFLLTLYLVVNHSSKNFGLVFLTTASIPMLLHQVGSYNYDATHITAGFILFFILFKLLDVKTFSLRLMLIYLCSLFVFYIIKPQSYWMFFATPLLFLDIVLKKISRRLLILIIFIYGLIAVLLFVNTQFGTFDKKEGSVNQDLNAALQNQQLQRTILIEDPEKILNVIFSTVEFQFWFYVRSFIGQLGWLDYELGMSLYFLFVGIIVYSLSMFRLPIKSNFPTIKALLCLTIILGTYILVMMGMYLLHTPLYYEIGGNISDGTQGRYFLLLLPVLFLAVGYLRHSKYGASLIFTVILLFAFGKTVHAVYLRYYNYQSLFDISTIVVDQTKELKYSSVFEPTMFDFSVDAERKFRGVSLGPIKIEKGIKMPYQFMLYENNCDERGEMLVSGITQNSNYMDNQINVIFKNPVLSGTTDSSMCFVIEPFINDESMIKSLSYIEKSDEIILEPIYIR